MSFWKERLQKSVQGLNANLTDSAARLRQQLLQPSPQVAGAQSGTYNGSPQQQSPTGDAGQQPPPQQYVRLPVESAKKLRWYDRQDLNMLIQLHLREKHELFEANTALRQALQRRGVSEQQLETEVVLNNVHVDQMREVDSAVGEVLAIAAQAEVERLREEVGSLAEQLQHMRQRLAVATQQQGQGDQRGVAPPQQLTTPSIGDGAEAGFLQLGVEEETVVLQLDFKPHNEGAAEAAIDEQSERPVQVALLVRPSSTPASSPAAAASLAHALAPILQQLVTTCAAATAAVLPPECSSLLVQGHAALGELLAQQGLSGGTATEESIKAQGGTAPPGGLSERCSQLEAANMRLQSELAQAQQEAGFVKDAAERKVQELRGRLSSSKQHLSELLRVAQDGRLEAEARREAAERRLQLAEARGAGLDSDVKDLKAEVKRVSQECKRLEREGATAEARAAVAEAAFQKAKGSAEADRSLAEVNAQQRARVVELDGQVTALQRQLAEAYQRGEGLEGRLAAANAAVARAREEVHELEGVVSERDSLAARLAVLEAYMDETRVERSQLGAARTVAAESEAKRARAEEELVTTARLAAALEARLAKAQAEIEMLQLEVQGANAARLAALESVEREVAERWEVAGADRTLWPPTAQEEMDNLEARISAMLTALRTIQQQAEHQAAEREGLHTQLASLESRLSDAEQSATRQMRAWSERERQLEATCAGASEEIADLRHALAEVGRERDRLLDEKNSREMAAQQAAVAVASARRLIGSGSVTESTGSSNGSAYLAWPAHGRLELSSLPSLSAAPVIKPPREVLDGTDVLYLKNVLLKFLDAQLAGRTQECEVLLPAVATLLRASPQEFKLLKDGLQRAAGVGGVFDPTAWFSGPPGSK